MSEIPNYEPAMLTAEPTAEVLGPAAEPNREFADGDPGISPEIAYALEHVVSAIDSDASSAAAPAGDQAEALRHWGEEVLALIEQRFEAQQRAMDEANRLGKERERVIDRLHEENQGLKNGERERALKPLLLDLIWLFDDLGKTAAEYAAREDATSAARDFALYRDAVSDVLAKQGVETYHVAPGDAFDKTAHRVLGTVPTEDAAADRQVVRVLRSGFRSDHQVIRSAEVEVFRFTTPTASA